MAFWSFRKKKKRDHSLAEGELQPGFIGHPRKEMVPMKDRTYNQDGLATIHSTGFAQETGYAKAYAAAAATGSWGGSQIHWRAHLQYWAAETALSVPGDFIECGTNRGGSAMGIVTYLGERLQGRRVLLFDTYCGLDPKVSSGEEISRLGHYYEDCYDEVVARFAPFPHVTVIRGTVPEILPANVSEQVAFFHLDLNAAEPERAAMEFIWPRLSPSGVVLLDDYAWVACAEQKKAHDAFAASLGLSILSLPTGQGLLIKPPRA